ncbi:MAG: hypothetical protein OEZ68_11870 [Gammaproteobacteria bacterium]|nr:hypothetical protein [Gammaproteobacteria bacterium]MDH5801492.1 hypothetical protein [Gammaproteobacteria bacterium]
MFAICPRRCAAFSVILTVLTSGMSVPFNSHAVGADAQAIVDHWTATRRSQAVPRDLFIDNRGLGYLRGSSNMLHPYAHQQMQLQSSEPVTSAKPTGGTRDSTAPSISNMDPVQNQTVGSNYILSANITDSSGIASVSFVIVYPDGISTQTLSAAHAGNDRWETFVDGFSDGNWSWYVVATDASRKLNTATSATVNFSVDVANGTGSYIVTNGAWNEGGAVQMASGRLYFEMPSEATRTGPWTAYVCSGSVVQDPVSGRSIVITAAHCVYDDNNKAFARKVLFIPNQTETTGTKSDRNCENDPMGCWVPSFGVVDAQWSSQVFPNNKAWDVAYYVFSDTGAHVGSQTVSEALDNAAGALPLSFLPPYVDDGDPSATSVDYTHALGYTYANDPNFMYCAQDMTTQGSVNWWLNDCLLAAGSSGGPWIQPMENGIGPVISLVSWRYTSSAGVAGPILSSGSAACMFGESTSLDFSVVPTTDGDAGVIIDYCL